MQIITTACIKGGSGKSTTAAALAQYAATAGRRVLAIDLDPQGNLTSFLHADQSGPGSVELLNNGDPQKIIQNTPQGVDTISGRRDLAGERTTPGSGRRLRQALEPIKENYDCIFIDTPPTMGELTFNALQAATALLIPLEADASSLQGLYQITDIARQIQEHNTELKYIFSIITRYDRRPNINRYFRDTIAEKAEHSGAPLLATIRPGIAIREAQGLRQSLYKYAPNSKPAQDYVMLFKLINRIMEG